MAVSLGKGIHRWVYFCEESVTFCRCCGTVLDLGDSPASDSCTVMHDAHCVCDVCRELINA